jgi:Saccharopine dehydrogenase NADP binding domain
VLVSWTPGGSTRDVRVATVDDHAALVAALRDCAVVVNCAGPFTMLGPPVVRAAIDAGRHYVDTAGEQPYVASVFATHGAAAERAGVSVVPAANDGCLPVDLLTHPVAAGDDVEQISTLHLIDGDTGMSRGSLRSLLTVLGTQPDNGVAAPPGALPFPMCEVVTIPRHVTVRRVAGLVNASLARRPERGPSPTMMCQSARSHARSSADPDTRRRSRPVTQRHPDVVDEVNSDCSINGACPSDSRAYRHPDKRKITGRLGRGPARRCVSDSAHDAPER